MRARLRLSSTAPDLLAQDTPETVWNASNNVVFRNGRCHRVGGDLATLEADVTARAMAFTMAEGVGYWVLVGNGKIVVHDGAVAYDVTPAGWTGSNDAVYSAVAFNGLVVINVSDRAPVYWNGSVVTPCEPLPGWIPDGRCLRMVSHKNFLFAVGMISEGSQRVRWSDAAEAGTLPQSWEPAADNLAGYVDLAPLWSPCFEARTLRDELFIYKGESVWAARFVGGNAVFAVRKVFAEAGVAASHCVCAGPNDEHLFIGSDGDCYLTDGVQVRSVLDGRARRSFYVSFASLEDPKFVATTLQREQLGLLMWGSKHCDDALMYDFSTGDIGYRRVPEVLCAGEGPGLFPDQPDNTWDAHNVSWKDYRKPWANVQQSATVDEVVVGTTNQGRYILSQDADDMAHGRFRSYLLKGGLAFGDANMRKLVTRLWPRVQGRTGDILKFRVGGQEITGGPVLWQFSEPFEIGTEEPISVMTSGRYIWLEVTSWGGAAWTLDGIDMDIRAQGAW